MQLPHKHLNTLRYEQSAQWIPEEFAGQETTNFRYIPELTEAYKRRILDYLEDAEFRESIVNFCPRKHDEAAWTVKDEDSAFVEMMGDLSPEKSRAASRIVDEHLAKNLSEGVLIYPSKLRQANLDRLQKKWPTRLVEYEGETNVHYDVQCGASLAVIDTKEPSLHVHNGSRLVICISETGTLDLPGKTSMLKQWDATWMPPYTLHSFHGRFLAFHTSEAGFEHPEALLPYRED